MLTKCAHGFFTANIFVDDKEVKVMNVLKLREMVAETAAQVHIDPEEVYK